METNLKIFLVEDSEIIREKLNRNLSEIPGIEIIGYADNATDAIDQINSTHPDIVTLDLRLKESSGCEVLQAAKKNHDPATFIVLTNFSSPYLFRKCLESGADFFLDKANEFERLIDICRELQIQTRHDNHCLKN